MCGCACLAGHRIEELPEVPLVVSDKVEELKRTKDAVALLKKLRAWRDIEKVRLNICYPVARYVYFKRCPNQWMQIFSRNSCMEGHCKSWSE